MDTATQLTRDSALAEIASLALSAETPEAANGYRHAALVIAHFPVPRALLQLQRHAGFVGPQEKRSAYLTSSAILARHTGETAERPASIAAAELPGFAFA